MEEIENFDALVIGAGAGGMAAAARLGNYGYRTLLVERRDRVGGRASTMEVDGFTVNSGAIFFELGGENSRLFDELGVDPGVRVLKHPLFMNLGKRNIPMMSGVTGLISRKSLVWLGHGARKFRLRPASGLNVEQWLDKLHAGKPIRLLVRNLTAALFAGEPSDIPADLFFDYFTKPSGLGIYGAHPDGSIGPWRAMADHFQRTGGTLWCDSEVSSLTFDADGLVDGAIVRRGTDTVRVSTKVAVSNVGPVATVNLCGDDALPSGYADEIRAWSRPGTLIIINFASHQRIPRLDGMVFFGDTERLASGANVSDLSPALAPPGWNLYMAASTPTPASGEFDYESEVAMLRNDLHAKFPEFGSAHELSVEVYAGEDWPAQRAIAGHDLPNTTPIANLWNVGDGVREAGGAAQSGCVQSARLVTDQIRGRYPAARL
ncbi:FAD-binding protein [Rhodococcus sp. WS4]|nr:FAD-binding protein [Rhodococcus sp. WS4]